jgi:hypothetical protein
LQIPLRDKTQNLNANGERMGFIPGSLLLAEMPIRPGNRAVQGTGVTIFGNNWLNL